MTTQNENFPSVRITKPAQNHVKEVVQILTKKGLRASITSVLSEAALNIPLPDPEPVSEVEKVPAMEQGG